MGTACRNVDRNRRKRWLLRTKISIYRRVKKRPCQQTRSFLLNASTKFNNLISQDSGIFVLHHAGSFFHLLLQTGDFLFLFCMGAKPPLCKGRWLPVGQTEGLPLSLLYNPPVSSADSPLYTRGPFPVPTIILQITLLVSVNERRLYRPKEKHKLVRFIPVLFAFRD